MLEMQRNHVPQRQAGREERRANVIICQGIHFFMSSNSGLFYFKPLLLGHQHVEGSTSWPDVVQLLFPVLCVHFDTHPLSTCTSQIGLGSIMDFWLEFLKLLWIFPSEMSSVFHSPETIHLHSHSCDYLVITKWIV